jgi:hypothetical protein
MSRTVPNLKPKRPSKIRTEEAQPPLEPKISRMSIDIPESERLQLKRIALDLNMSLRDVVLTALREKYQLIRGNE